MKPAVLQSLMRKLALSQMGAPADATRAGGVNRMPQHYDPLTAEILMSTLRDNIARADSLRGDVAQRVQAEGGREALERRGRERRILEKDYGANTARRVDTLFEMGAPFSEVVKHISPLMNRDYTDALLERLRQAGKNWMPGMPHTDIQAHSDAVLDSLFQARSQ
mgnify:CR=1 FL=1